MPTDTDSVRAIATRHLIHVGFPKAGSTSLQRWFAERPEIAFTQDALGGFPSAWALIRETAHREALPAWCVTSAEGLVIPRAHAGLTSPAGNGPIAARRARVCELLAALFADATILIVTRGYRGALTSLYSEYVRLGGTWRFDRYISGADQESVPGSMVDAYLDYDAVVSLFERRFGSERVIVLPYELMRDDPAGFVAGLEDLLGLSRSGIAIEWLNPRLTGAELAWYPVFSRVARAVARRGPRRDRVLSSYRARIGRSGLRRAATVLACLARTDVQDLEREVPDDVLQRFRGRADGLGARALYNPYLDDYLIGPPATE